MSGNVSCIRRLSRSSPQGQILKGISCCDDDDDDEEECVEQTDEASLVAVVALFVVSEDSEVGISSL